LTEWPTEHSSVIVHSTDKGKMQWVTDKKVETNDLQRRPSK